MQLGLLISWSISVISHHIVKLINKNWPKNYYSVQCHSHFESFGKIQVCIDATSNRYTHNIHNWWRKRNENYDVKIKQTSAINMKWLFWKKNAHAIKTYHFVYYLRNVQHIFSTWHSMHLNFHFQFSLFLSKLYYCLRRCVT